MSDNQDQQLSQSELLDALELEIKKIETTGLERMLSQLRAYVARTGDKRAGWEAYDMFIHYETERTKHVAGLMLVASEDGLAQYKQKAQTTPDNQIERKEHA